MNARGMNGSRVAPPAGPRTFLTGDSRYTCVMSKMADALRADRPDWTVPAELECAWCWMEARGLAVVEDGYCMAAPFPIDEAGPFFTSEPAAEAALEAWIADFEARGVEGVGMGYLIVHRPDPDSDGAPRAPPRR